MGRWLQTQGHPEAGGCGCMPAHRNVGRGGDDQETCTKDPTEEHQGANNRPCSARCGRVAL